MTESSGIWCLTAVHSTPGPNIMSPSGWKFTEKLPNARLASAGSANVVIVLVHRQNPAGPGGKSPVTANRRPVEILDLRIDFHRHPRGTDRGRIPRVGRGLPGAIAGLAPGLLHCCATRLEVRR